MRKPYGMVRLASPQLALIRLSVVSQNEDFIYGFVSSIIMYSMNVTGLRGILDKSLFVSCC